MKLMILFVFILVNQLNQIESCFCFYPPPEGHYCQSAFSARVLVKDEQHLEQEHRIYLVDVEQIYRANDVARKALADGKLHTFGSSAACGVDDLVVNRRYIVTGSVSKGRTSIGGCNFHVAYDDVDQNIKKGFEGEYQSRCS